jgi:hypothetical protein
MIKRFPKIWLALLILLMVVAGFAAVKVIQARSVRADAPTAGVYWTCSPNLVVSANIRVVARCASGYVISGGPTIYWFAYPTKDSANASRMLSVFETAKATGSTITLYFDTNDVSGGNYGCDPSNCRAIWAVTTP